MRVFVTGGTGLLGNTVIRELSNRGDEIVALVRADPDPEVFAGLNVELVCDELPGSASDPPDDGNSVSTDLIDEAIAGCDAVVHSAAMIHLGWKRMEQSIDVNARGTERIARSCLRHGKRLVQVGTVNAIALGSPHVFADETTPLEHAGGQVECAYVVSKRLSVNVVRDLATEGLDAIIVHPGFMLGPWDWKPSSGRMMLELGKGWKPVAPSGGCSLCDARDVAAAVVRALQVNCQSGREYILAGHNWSYRKLWTEMATRMGKRPPLRAAGPGIEYLAGLAGDAWTWISGKEADLNSAGIAMSAQYHWYDSSRAARELGYTIRDAAETLDAAGEWIRGRFLLP
jgi:dihydroflavonol-4-reductase